VTAEFQKGYRLHGRVVRPSLVRVGSGKRRAED
jgi:molecular chaperone GrpE (heat shock protein)